MSIDLSKAESMLIRLHPWLGAALAVAAQLAAAQNSGGNLVVALSDRDGRAVSSVAVYALPLDAPSPVSAAVPRAIVDQRNRAFVPHVTIARAGTEILFPNSDSVSHHVYSFSPAKAFELPLYKHGAVHAPLRFDTPGLVTLGCNIHDDMVGYVLIVDTPHFALTDRDGRAFVDGLPAGRYSVHAWTPRMRPGDLPAPVEVSIGDNPKHVAVQFAAKLYPPHESSEAGLQWSRY